jgi:hypothetical protein
VIIIDPKKGHGGDHAIPARTVFHWYGLAPTAREPIGEKPERRLSPDAGCEWGNEAHRAVRKCLSLCAEREREGEAAVAVLFLCRSG